MVAARQDVGQGVARNFVKNSQWRVRAASTRTGVGGAFSTPLLFAPARNDFHENGSEGQTTKRRSSAPPNFSGVQRNRLAYLTPLVA
jgi:hypothetical protein